MYDDMIVQGCPIHGRLLGDVLRIWYEFEGEKYFVDLSYGNNEGESKIKKRIRRRVASDLVRIEISSSEKRFRKVLDSGDLKRERIMEQWRQRRW